MATSNTNQFKTRDLQLAAFLVASDFQVQNIETDGKGLLFCFPAEASEGELLFLRGEKVAARQLFSALRDLKSLIYSIKNNMNMEITYGNADTPQ